MFWDIWTEERTPKTQTQCRKVNARLLTCTLITRLITEGWRWQTIHTCVANDESTAAGARRLIAAALTWMFYKVTSVTVSILARSVSPPLWRHIRRPLVHWRRMNLGTNKCVHRHENKFCTCNTFINNFLHSSHFIYSLLCSFSFTLPIIALLLNYRDCSDMHWALRSGCVIRALF